MINDQWIKTREKDKKSSQSQTLISRQALFVLCCQRFVFLLRKTIISQKYFWFIVSIFKEHNPSKSRKLVRELARVQRDFIGVVHRIKFWWLQRRYDNQWPAQLLLTDGTQPPSSKIAVLAMYQPGGLRASTLETCDHLADCGYTVVAVSNTPLNEADRNTLAHQVYKICERPNYGYDAGAYRDGVWLLRREGLKPDSLILINDSILFPLQKKTDAISRLEAKNDTLGGLVRKTRYKADLKVGGETTGFIEAYFYHANLRDPDIRSLWETFWDQLRLTSGRAYLKEGRVSEFFDHANQPLNTLSSRNSFLQSVEEMNNSELLKTLQYGAYCVPELSETNKQLLASEPDTNWRRTALDHIRETVSRYPFYGSFIYGSESLMQLGFLKRTNSPLFRETRKSYLRAVDAGDLPRPSDTILSELRELIVLHKDT
ncbi:rhamnan synthesis F family protein [Shimia sp. R9_3]|uniref:rhamnan synthesis F family protein n=1 Tax=Shimia sp. R9_3 TaxID=2821113 RepID=UPI001ADC6192|nr:rhamnan synthesis F family protein [Shimia sp. R9_3]MBO9402067.1 hypothetical protein [Shimia sp. R9_3]